MPLHRSYASPLGPTPSRGDTRAGIPSQTAAILTARRVVGPIVTPYAMSIIAALRSATTVPWERPTGPTSTVRSRTSAGCTAWDCAGPEVAPVTESSPYPAHASSHRRPCQMSFTTLIAAGWRTMTSLEAERPPTMPQCARTAPGSLDGMERNVFTGLDLVFHTGRRSTPRQQERSRQDHAAEVQSP